jgi:hypothetical protein
MVDYQWHNIFDVIGFLYSNISVDIIVKYERQLRCIGGLLIPEQQGQKLLHLHRHQQLE